MTERSTDILCARVYLAQARHWRLTRGYAAAIWLLEWAGNARRRAASGPLPTQQLTLF